MKKIIFAFTLITFFSCEVQYNEIPADWLTFEKKNISGLGAAKIKFKHPPYWIQNDQAGKEIVTTHLLTYFQNDSLNSTITINAAFNVNIDKTFDEFVDSVLVPTLHAQNKRSIKIKRYNAYSFDLLPLNGEVTKVYMLDNDENPVFIVIRASNKGIFDEKIAEAESIVNTVYIGGRSN